MKANKNIKDLLEKKKIFKIFTVIAFSFLLSGVVYIHLIVLKTKSLLIVKKLEDEKRKVSFQNSELRNKYINISGLYNIEKKAKSRLEMFYPDEIIYFDIINS